jgi:hypothetical protein
VDTNVSEEHLACIFPEEEGVVTRRLKFMSEMIYGNGVFVVYFTALPVSPTVASDDKSGRISKLNSFHIPTLKHLQLLPCIDDICLPSIIFPFYPTDMW